MDARWLDVEADYGDAIEHFSNAGVIFDARRFDCEGIDGYKERMAFMHAMQSGYTSFENGLMKVFNILGESIPSGAEWHKDLLRRASRVIPEDRPAIISEKLAEDADQVRRFWHVAVRSYNNFQVQEASRPVLAARDVSARLLVELGVFKSMIDTEFEASGDVDAPK